MRWIRGYFDNRKKYISRFRKIVKGNKNRGSVIFEIVGMTPYILMIIGVLLIILEQILGDFQVGKIMLVLVLAYIIFLILTLGVVVKDKKLDIDRKMKVKAVLVSPLFFLTYVPCALKALLKKNITWTKVEHSKRWKEKE